MSSTTLPMTLPASTASCAAAISARGNRAPMLCFSTPSSSIAVSSAISGVPVFTLQLVENELQRIAVPQHRRKRDGNIAGDVGAVADKGAVWLQDALGEQ